MASSGYPSLLLSAGPHCTSEPRGLSAGGHHGDQGPIPEAATSAVEEATWMFNPTLLLIYPFYLK